MPDRRHLMASDYRELGDAFAAGGLRLESEQAYRLASTLALGESDRRD